MSRNRRRLFNLVQGTPRFEAVKNATGSDKSTQSGPAEMYLYDEISYWGVTAADFVAELASLGGQDFHLHVNSPGGDVFEGLAMLNSLRAYKGKVTVVVDGIAASAASFLIMGADEVLMGRNSELMIHDAWGMCLGNAADMQKMAADLDRVSDNIADVYAGKAGGSVADWRAAMKDESWYSATDAVEAGLADSVVTAKIQGDDPVAYDLSRFSNKNRTAAPVADESPVTHIKDDEFTIPDGLDILGDLRRAFEEAYK